MPSDANGNYSLPASYFVQNGDTVLPVQHNPPFEDVAQALTSRIMKDGRTVLTGNLQMGGFKVTGMDDGTNPGDAVNKSQLDPLAGAVEGYGTIASAATMDIGGEPEGTLEVTGTTTVTSLGTADEGVTRRLIFEGALTLTHNATSLINLTGADITTAEGDIAKFVSEGGGNWRMTDYSLASGKALAETVTTYPRGYIYGLTVSNNTTDAAHDLDIAAGEAASDNTVPVLISLTSALTKQADVTFAEGDDAGGMVSGESLPTSGTIHIWAIMKADGTVDICFNNNATSGLSPSLPTDFIYKRRIGSRLTDGSANIVATSQLGDEVLLSVPAVDVNSTNPGTSAVLNSLSVPNGIKVHARVSIHLKDTSGTQSRLLATSPDQADTAPTSTNFTMEVNSVSAEDRHEQVFGDWRTNTSGQIRTRVSNSDSDTIVGIVTHGWIDERGQFG